MTTTEVTQDYGRQHNMMSTAKNMKQDEGTNIQQLVNEVRKRLQRIEADTKCAHLIFLDRLGYVDYVSYMDEVDEFPTVELLERAGKPHFEICSVRPSTGECFVGDNWITDMTDEILSEAVAAADAERTRFYTERAEVYGESAYPVSRWKLVK